MTYLFKLLVMISKNIETQRYHGDIMNAMEAKLSTTICYERKMCKNSKWKICKKSVGIIFEDYEVPIGKKIYKYSQGKMSKNSKCVIGKNSEAAKNLQKLCSKFW